MNNAPGYSRNIDSESLNSACGTVTIQLSLRDWVTTILERSWWHDPRYPGGAFKLRGDFANAALHQEVAMGGHVKLSLTELPFKVQSNIVIITYATLLVQRLCNAVYYLVKTLAHHSTKYSAS
jgi:hypothetical protein